LCGEHLDAESVDAAASHAAATSRLVVADLLAIHFRRQSEHQPGFRPAEWWQRIAVPAAAEKWRRQRFESFERQPLQHRLAERQRVRRRQRRR
jgi:hypothetical protein